MRHEWQLWSWLRSKSNFRYVRLTPDFGDEEMKAITRRLNRIENQLWPPPPKPRTRFRVVIRKGDVDAPMVRNRDCEPSFEKASCTRSLCPDGTLWEVVRLDTMDGGAQPTDAELNTWIGGLPIEPLANFEHLP